MPPLATSQVVNVSDDVGGGEAGDGGGGDGDGGEGDGGGGDGEMPLQTFVPVQVAPKLHRPCTIKPLKQALVPDCPPHPEVVPGSTLNA